MAENGDVTGATTHAGEEESSLMEKIAEKLHLNKEEEEHHKEAEKVKESSSSSSSSDSASDSEAEKVKETSSAAVASGTASDIKEKIFRLFGREKPLHQVLGAGKPADVFLWRNKKISAGVLATGTAIWVLFELLEYHLLTLICHSLIFSLAILFLWANVTTLINMSA